MILASKDKKFLEKIFRLGKLFVVWDFLEYLYIMGYFNIKYSDRSLLSHLIQILFNL